MAQTGGDWPGELRAYPEDPDAAKEVDREERGSDWEGAVDQREGEVVFGVEDHFGQVARKWDLQSARDL